MDNLNIFVVYLVLFRLSIIAAGIISVVLGYRLFIKGVFPRGDIPQSAGGHSVDAEVAGAFAVAGVLRRDQPGVREKMSHAGEAVDVVNFVEQHVREDLADSGDRPQQEPSLRIMHLGLPQNVQLQSLQQRVVMPDRFQVCLDVVPGALFGEAVEHVAVGGVS